MHAAHSLYLYTETRDWSASWAVELAWYLNNQEHNSMRDWARYLYWLVPGAADADSLRMSFTRYTNGDKETKREAKKKRTRHRGRPLVGENLRK